jgi:hypothetical protein
MKTVICCDVFVSPPPVFMGPVLHILAEWLLCPLLNTCYYKGTEFSDIFSPSFVNCTLLYSFGVVPFLHFYYSLTQNESTYVKLIKTDTAAKSTTFCKDTHTKYYLAKSTLTKTLACTPKHIFHYNICGTRCDKGRWYLITVKIIKLRFKKLITLVSLPYKNILIPRLLRNLGTTES